MKYWTKTIITLIAATPAFACAAQPDEKSTDERGPVLAAYPELTNADWRPLDPENTLYLDLEGGRVVIELAPQFAPGHATNIKALAREGFYDGLTIYRFAEGFVAQGGDGGDIGNRGAARKVKTAKRHIAPEFTRPNSNDLPFVEMPDKDSYAPETGFSYGFPVGRDPETGEAWMLHCPRAVAMARGIDPTTGGTEFNIILTTQRYLDRNVTVFGRVVDGLEHIQRLNRGPALTGFIKEDERRNPIIRMQVAADLPEDEREHIEVMRSDTAAIKQLIEFRRNRPEPWFVYRVEHADICSIPMQKRRTEAD